MNNLHLVIEGRSYRLVSIEDNGTFIAVKEVVTVESMSAQEHYTENPRWVRLGTSRMPCMLALG
jgi:hypothetical protein